MAKVSKKTAAHVEDMGVMEGHYGEVGAYTVGFESFREDADGAPLFRGLPDDQCQSPHWGYVKSGRVTFRFADHDEVYEAATRTTCRQGTSRWSRRGPRSSSSARPPITSARWRSSRAISPARSRRER